MAYQIDRYSRALLTVVEDGTVDETTDLRFIGKNYSGYGEIHNENFLYLLENFSNANPPPRPLSGQVWFDSSTSKLKFYDGSIWRTTGGSEVAASEPAGLTEGDFWWDNANDQLYVFNGASFVLIGPQEAGEGTTQLVSQNITDTQNNVQSIIVGFVEDVAVFVISRNQFNILQQQDNLLDGFTFIRQGITLRDSAAGNTTSAYRFFGTASDAAKLGNKPPSDYVTFANPDFANQITTGTSGIAIATDFVLQTESSGTDPQRAIISNKSGASNEIHFRTQNVTNDPIHSLTVTWEGLFPASTQTFNLGSTSLEFDEVHARSFVGGSAAKADTLKIPSGAYLSASADAVGNTIAARTQDNKLFADEFVGTATSAKFADLAEIYRTDNEYPVGTILSVGGTEEVKAAEYAEIPVGVISDEPAFLMNREARGQAVALKGRVPVRVVGSVAKGQPIYVSKNGVGSVSVTGEPVGIALHGKTGTSEGLVECILKV